MISTASLLAIVFTLLVVILFPTLLAIGMYIRFRISWKPILVGALVFLVFQLLTRVPLLSILSATPWYRSLAASPLLLGLFLGVTAGLFEEVGRWLGFRYLLKGYWQTKNGIAYGIGHGGFEAISLIGLSYVNNLVISLMINSGQYDVTMAPQLGSAAEVVKQTLVNTPWYLFMIAGVERVMAIIVHIALSLVVLMGVRTARPIFLLYAILLHTLLNFPLAYLSGLPNGWVLSEVYLLTLAIIAYLFIRRRWQHRSEVQPPAAGELSS